MPVNINWLDLVIVILLILSLIQGIRVGLIRSVFNIAGIVAGIAVAMSYYTPLASFILEYISLPRIGVEIFSFVVIFSLTAVIINLAGSLFYSVTGFSLIRIVDKIGGSTVGVAIGVVLIGVFLILLTSFPVYAEFPDHVEKSCMAPTIINITTSLYDHLSTILPFNLPRIATYPESLGSYVSNVSIYTDHKSVDFKGLDGATCFACGEPVTFLGFLDNGKGSISPKFLCSGCGRTSDGCQTYEGYHAMYDVCPVELSKQGYRFDCGIWTNHRYIKPIGTCPVCGAE